MPGRCEPCPENTNATRAALARSDTTPAATRPAANASSPARSSSTERPDTTARCSNTERVPASARAPAGAGNPGRSRTNAANAPAWAASACSERPDTTHGTRSAVPDPDTTGSTAPESRGGSSTITCALVPLIPNEETPNRRRRSPRGHGTASASSRTAPDDQSTSGVGSSAYSERGSSSCRSASTILITPATPAAACVCPMLDFTEPSHSGRPVSRPVP